MGLVIQRKLLERVRIGDVWVQVVQIDSTKIRLLIDAPKSVEIWREELLDPATGKPYPDVKKYPPAV